MTFFSKCIKKIFKFVVEIQVKTGKAGHYIYSFVLGVENLDKVGEMQLSDWKISSLGLEKRGTCLE